MYKILEKFGLETGAFTQLTRKYMAENFNPKTPDLEGVKYAVDPIYRCFAYIHLQVLFLRSITRANTLVCLLVISQNHERNWR